MDKETMKVEMHAFLKERGIMKTYKDHLRSTGVSYHNALKNGRDIFSNTVVWGSDPRTNMACFWTPVDRDWRTRFDEYMREQEEAKRLVEAKTAKEILAMTLGQLGCTIIDGKDLMVPSSPFGHSITLASLGLELKEDGPPINEKFLALFILSEKRHPLVTHHHLNESRHNVSGVSLLSTHIDDSGKRMYCTRLGFCDQITMTDEGWSTFQKVIEDSVLLPSIVKRHGEPE